MLLRDPTPSITAQSQLAQKGFWTRIRESGEIYWLMDDSINLSDEDNDGNMFLTQLWPDFSRVPKHIKPNAIIEIRGRATPCHTFSYEYLLLDMEGSFVRGLRESAIRSGEDAFNLLTSCGPIDEDGDCYPEYDEERSICWVSEGPVQPDTFVMSDNSLLKCISEEPQGDYVYIYHDRGLTLIEREGELVTVVANTGRWCGSLDYGPDKRGGMFLEGTFPGYVSPFDNPNPKLEIVTIYSLSHIPQVKPLIIQEISRLRDGTSTLNPVWIKNAGVEFI